MTRCLIICILPDLEPSNCQILIEYDLSHNIIDLVTIFLTQAGDVIEIPYTELDEHCFKVLFLFERKVEVLLGIRMLTSKRLQDSVH